MDTSTNNLDINIDASSTRSTEREFDYTGTRTVTHVCSTRTRADKVSAL